MISQILKVNQERCFCTSLLYGMTDMDYLYCMLPVTLVNQWIMVLKPESLMLIGPCISVIVEE
jgi:hypothetical protein